MTNGSKHITKNKYIFCNKCRNETNHILKAEHYRDYPNNNPDGSLGFVERLGNRFWVCAGCDRGTLEEFYIFDVTIDDYITLDHEAYFPERTKLHVEGKNFK